MLIMGEAMCEWIQRVMKNLVSFLQFYYDSKIAL